ncbi:MAG: phosphoribosylformylglycinamidine synthase subunit PurQ [Oscillospiraceae bacterium]|nr:phosphoribosylformylglycinamidine synthase subunit PurQ [Oscillospiraceae bacterium]
MERVLRFYTEKIENRTHADLSEALELPNFKLRTFIRYDIQSQPFDVALLFDSCRKEHLPDLPEGTRLLRVEPVPGQFDAIADSCEQCIQLLIGGKRPTVKTAFVYAFTGLNEAEFNRAAKYLINPLEYCPANPDKPESLPEYNNESKGGKYDKIPEINLSDTTTESLGLAMSSDDLDMIREYFKSENRNPTLTEIKVLDTYWSDHCRHTTFNTIIKDAVIGDERVKEAFELFKSVNGEKPVTLMNIATAAMRHFKKSGELPMLDESDEINACTIKVEGESGKKLLLFFKNETHNHPTEIEPFGGASTCIGGAIRDPLSGRSYVYQGMRITGAASPNQPVKDTIPGKLPQRKLIETAAEGFSSYANQIGAATGYIKEIYHTGYAAKRMEAGAVVAAANMDSVRRERPKEGDIVLLLGGRTGKDGIGGATGSSITHDAETVSRAACEVQKGNPPEERRIQILFRNPEVTKLIKKCNDFGAGGVAVAVGELADGLEINLDAVPLKYPGLNGTETAISESQERMAIVIAEKDLPTILEHCDKTSVEASVIAKVTNQNRLVMTWQGDKIVDISREFLDLNGAKRYATVEVKERNLIGDCRDFKISGDNTASQKELASRFDSSVGALSVFMPYGGKTGESESAVMAAMIPGGGTTASIMAYGFEPHLTEADPFGGSAYAVVSSVAKVIAAGGNLNTVHLSFQEYFPRVTDQSGNNIPSRWGLPFAALLGGFKAQMGLKIAAIGGKDSMSGSYGDLDVPPTLISFAVGTGDAKVLVSPEFKGGVEPNPVYIINVPVDDYNALRTEWEKYGNLIKAGKVLAADVVTSTLENCINNMSKGNNITLDRKPQIQANQAAIIFEATEELNGCELLGYTVGEPLTTAIDGNHKPIVCQTSTVINCVIPILPGTTGEYDTAAALERAGGNAQTILIRNLTPSMLTQSIDALKKAISSSRMLVLPGGVDSDNMLVSLFKNPALADSIQELIECDGLVLGIGDGFKALLRLGLIENCRLASEYSGRHCHKYVGTKLCSATSPWLSECKSDEIYVQPISLSTLVVNSEGGIPESQIAFRYTDGTESEFGIEAITSVNGQILGKAAHFERYNPFTAKNIPGKKYLPLFEGAIKKLCK